MAKPKPPVNVPVLSLDEISTYSADDAADAFGHRYCARARSFVEMGKLIFHLENRVKLAKGQSIYGLLQKRGVPESSVNNARLVEKFITAFVVPGLVTESRFDAICTFRTVNVCARMKATIANNILTIEIPLQTPRPSASGKTLVVASSGGNITTTATVAGKAVTIGLNAYIKP